ncbi:centrosomal protein of 44 kDa isoform X2 [Kryptolebias marmoratus]|uniref:Centrosomal protein of 44 kDa n=1 Tax=Kryptolebias marmoratus TaxID=37003 RepID=A0A3Q3AV13_KRYMA|nr:centrosomal protein of 44 kDa isoform X2 [Kryptolebias marmoratus]
MLSAGDVQSYVRKLESLLRGIKYPGHVDYNGLCKGDPSAFLPIMSFTMTSYSPPFAEQLMAAGLELSSKTDLRFTDTIYKVLRDVFHYKPILGKQQFLQLGFSQRKISFLCDIINLVQQRHHQLKKVLKKPFVAGRLENSSTFGNPPEEETFSSHDAACTSYIEVYSSGSSGKKIPNIPEGGESKESISSEVEGRLSALEAQLQGLLSGLDKLNILEKRLEELEKHKNTDKNDGPVITISRDTWENLMSRIILLETKDELRNTQASVSLHCQTSASSQSLNTISDASQVDIKERLERITTMLKNSSGLLKNTESFTTTCK